MAAIFQTTFSNGFSWMKVCEFRFEISLKSVPKGPINIMPALVQKIAWRRPGDKPLSEPLMVSFGKSTNSSEIWIKRRWCPLKKVHFKMSAKCRQFCFVINVGILRGIDAFNDSVMYLAIVYIPIVCLQSRHFCQLYVPILAGWCDRATHFLHIFHLGVIL